VGRRVENASTLTNAGRPAKGRPVKQAQARPARHGADAFFTSATAFGFLLNASA
jgi:hypothetical protein